MESETRPGEEGKGTLQKCGSAALVRLRSRGRVGLQREGAVALLAYLPEASDDETRYGTDGM